jgi:hypothetical protein
MRRCADRPAGNDPRRVVRRAGDSGNSGDRNRLASGHSAEHETAEFRSAGDSCTNVSSCCRGTNKTNAFRAAGRACAWEERTSRMFDRREGASTAAGGHQSDTGSSFASHFLLPDEVVPEVDFYDIHPVAISAPVSQEAAEPLLTENGINRLKTDIRTIEPTLNYALKGIDPTQLPADFNRKMDNGDYAPRTTSPTVFQWAPTNLYHYPLYFEDPSLERYGHTYHPLVQPFASTGRFATQLVGLPYQMTLHPIHSHDYTLGYYRPGECAPKKHYQIPFNEEATIIQVATVVGLIMILP